MRTSGTLTRIKIPRDRTFNSNPLGSDVLVTRDVSHILDWFRFRLPFYSCSCLSAKQNNNARLTMTLAIEAGGVTL